MKGSVSRVRLGSRQPHLAAGEVTFWVSKMDRRMRRETPVSRVRLDGFGPVLGVSLTRETRPISPAWPGGEGG